MVVLGTIWFVGWREKDSSEYHTWVNARKFASSDHQKHYEDKW